VSEDPDQNKAWQYFQTINNALNGLLEILTMGFEKDDVVFQAGIENLKILKENMVELLQHDYKPEEIKKKIRDLEFDIKMKLFFTQDDDKDKEEHGVTH